MRAAWGVLFFLLSGCWANRAPGGDDQAIVHSVPAVKQKQKIAFLQKKLDFAEKEKIKADKEVERLSQEVHEAQLALIRKQVGGVEEQIRKLQADPQKYAQLLQYEASALFLKEREILHQLIQTGPSPSAFEAQVVLDRILRMITDLSNDSPR
jgi:hypothetical protein